MIFTNHYYPETFRINALSEKFSADWDISVVTQVPNYPSGNFFSGYSNFKNRTEYRNDVEIIRLPVIPRKQSSLMLFLNYISYTTSTFFFGLFTRRTVDHVFVYATSPIFLSWSALRIAKKNKVKSTLYLLDLWPESLTMSLKIKNKFIIKRLDKMTQKIYQRFDNIIVSSESFKQSLIERGIDECKISHIPQHADELLEKPLEIKEIKDKVNIVFAGNIGTAQGLDTLVDSISHLDKEGFKNVHVTLVGDGRNRCYIERLIKDEQLEEYFTIVGRVPFEEVKDYLAQSHFSYVSLIDEVPLNQTLPAKVQSYMSYGVPILACASGEIPKIIEQSQCGVYSEFDSIALADKIKEISTYNHEQLTLMGYNGYKYSQEHFDLNKISADFEKIMKEGI